MRLYVKTKLALKKQDRTSIAPCTHWLGRSTGVSKFGFSQGFNAAHYFCFPFMTGIRRGNGEVFRDRPKAAIVVIG